MAGTVKTLNEMTNHQTQLITKLNGELERIKSATETMMSELAEHKNHINQTAIATRNEELSALVDKTLTAKLKLMEAIKGGR